MKKLEGKKVGILAKHAGWQFVWVRKTSGQTVNMRQEKNLVDLRGTG